MTPANLVKHHAVTVSCDDCADLHREPDKQPYEGTYTYYFGACQICRKTKQVTSAKKLFGYYRR